MIILQINFTDVGLNNQLDKGNNACVVGIWNIFYTLKDFPLQSFAFTQPIGLYHP